MIDCMLELIYFDQKLTLSKEEYSVESQDELSVILRYQGEMLCRPYIYFRPLNLSDRKTEYHFSELMFECYEGHVDVVSQTVAELEEHLVIETRYAMQHGDEGGELSGLNFTYHEEDFAYHYEIENSIVPEETACTPHNPLNLTPQGTLVAEAVEVPLVGSYLCPT